VRIFFYISNGGNEEGILTYALYEEEDTCQSYEEEDTCQSYEEGILTYALSIPLMYGDTEDLSVI
jgi:hypothetical protein